MAIARTSMGSQLTGNRMKKGYHKMPDGTMMKDSEHKAGDRLVSKKVRKSHRKHAKQRRRSLALLVKK
jgi:hypothetical protein